MEKSSLKAKISKRDGIFVFVILVLLVTLIGIVNPFASNDKEIFKPFTQALLDVDSSIEVGATLKEYSLQVSNLKSALKQVEMQKPDKELLELAQSATDLHYKASNWWNKKISSMDSRYAGPKETELGDVERALLISKFGTHRVTPKQYLQYIWSNTSIRSEKFLERIYSDS